MSLRLTCKNSGIALDDDTIIYALMGAEGEGDPAEDDDEDPEDEEEDEPDESKKPKATDSDPEKDALKRRMKAADRRAAAAETKLRELDDKDKSELEVQTRRVNELEAENEKLLETNKTLRRERLFLGSNTVTWHDPEIAMSKLDWDNIIDEDGEVDHSALNKAITGLAKEKAFLVKKDTADDDANRPNTSQQQQASGGKVGSGKKNSKQEIDREALLKRFPALR
jgi:hypothetical protein